MSEIEQALLAFTDFESSGLYDDQSFPEGRTPQPYEVAVVLTDVDLNEIWRYESLLWSAGFPGGAVRVREVDEERALVHPSARILHDQTGLWNDLRYGNTSTIEYADVAISQGLSTWRKVKGIQRIMMAGSGVMAYDRRLIRTAMPLFSSVVHYQTVDVTGFERFANHILKRDIEPIEPAHRAMGDVLQSIERAKRLYKEFGRV